MSNIIRGKKLMLWIKAANGEYKSCAFATNHTLSTSASTISISHKDLADAGSNGHWDSQAIDTLTWSITTENLYANVGEGYTFADLWNFYSTGTELDVKFGVAADSSTGVPTNGWAVPAAGTVLTGKAVISSIDCNAPTAEDASFSCTLQGVGPLVAES